MQTSVARNISSPPPILHPSRSIHSPRYSGIANSTSLASIYPEYNWNIDDSPNSLNDASNHRLYLNWLASQFHISEAQQWYGVDFRSISRSFDKWLHNITRTSRSISSNSTTDPKQTHHRNYKKSSHV